VQRAQSLAVGERAQFLVLGWDHWMGVRIARKAEGGPAPWSVLLYDSHYTAGLMRVRCSSLDAMARLTPASFMDLSDVEWYFHAGSTALRSPGFARVIDLDAPEAEVPAGRRCVMEIPPEHRTHPSVVFHLAKANLAVDLGKVLDEARAAGPLVYVEALVGCCGPSAPPAVQVAFFWTAPEAARVLLDSMQDAILAGWLAPAEWLAAVTDSRGTLLSAVDAALDDAHGTEASARMLILAAAEALDAPLWNAFQTRCEGVAKPVSALSTILLEAVDLRSELVGERLRNLGGSVPALPAADDAPRKRKASEIEVDDGPIDETEEDESGDDSEAFDWGLRFDSDADTWPRAASDTEAPAGLIDGFYGGDAEDFLNFWMGTPSRDGEPVSPVN
jgi:hypothetical protein